MKKNSNDHATTQLLEEIAMACNELVTVLMYAHDINPEAYYKWKDEQKAKFMEQAQALQNQFTQPEELAKAINEQLNKK